MALIYDAIVVGAGPAGAILAYLLGKSGLRVLLLEKANLPRYKTCGGGLTFKAIRDLPFDVRPVAGATLDWRMVSVAMDLLNHDTTAMRS